MTAFNINNSVRVKLNERGLKILRDQHNELARTAPSLGEFKPPETDADGWTSFQFWSLMQAFGPHITLGLTPPFETEIDIPDAP